MFEIKFKGNFDYILVVWNLKKNQILNQNIDIYVEIHLLELFIIKLRQKQLYKYNLFFITKFYNYYDFSILNYYIFFPKNNSL